MKKKIILICIGLTVLGLIVALATLMVAGFDMEKITGEREIKGTYTLLSDFDDITIDGYDCEVIILVEPNEMNKTYIEYKGTDLNYADSRTETGTLSITKKRNWYDFFVFSAFNYPSITVRLSKEDFDNVSIINSSGEITVKGISADNLELKASSGGIKVSSVNAVDADVQTSSGSVELCDCNCTNVKIKTSSGSVRVSDTNGKTVESKTVSGKTELKNVTAEEIITSGTSGSQLYSNVAGNVVKAQTSSGNVRVDCCSVKKYEINTSSGDVSGVIKDDTIYSVKTSSGRINVPDPVPGAVNIFEATTSSGNVTIKNK